MKTIKYSKFRIILVIPVCNLILPLTLPYRVCLKSVEKNFFSEFLLPINVQTVSIPQNVPLGRQYTFGSVSSTPGRHPGRQMTEDP